MSETVGMYLFKATHRHNMIKYAYTCTSAPSGLDMKAFCTLFLLSAVDMNMQDNVALWGRMQGKHKTKYPGVPAGYEK